VIAVAEGRRGCGAPNPHIALDQSFCCGCGERGARLDWLTRIEGMTVVEAVRTIKDWPGRVSPRRKTVATSKWLLGGCVPEPDRPRKRAR